MIQRQKGGLHQTKPAKLPKPCKYCKGLGHLAFGCRQKPRKPLKAKKPMRKVGKVAKRYPKLRRDFLKANPGPHFCYYCLAVGVEQELPDNEIFVEHYYSKVRHPDLRFDITQLVKSCGEHNKLKGSLDGPEFLELIKEN